MKQTIKILAILLLISTIAISQGQDRQGKNSTPEERAQRRAETMKAKLELTDAQYKEMYEQFLSNEKQIQVHKDAIKKIHEDSDAKLKSVLTPDQYTKFKEMQAKRREMMREKRQH